MSNPLHQIVNAFEDTYKRVNGLNDDFVKSDYCTECGGVGYVEEDVQETRTLTTFTKEQCAECEHLHRMEVRADRMMDEAKGN